MARQSPSVCGWSVGNAETSAPTPAEIADCGVEDVVDHQCSGGKQAGVLAQVLRGDRVAAAAVGIGIDGLAVGEVDNREQDNDGEADRVRCTEFPRGPGESEALEPPPDHRRLSSERQGRRPECQRSDRCARRAPRKLRAAYQRLDRRTT